MFDFLKKKMAVTYSYDDVTLIPAYSDLSSRKNANPNMFNYKLPIISSCMDTLGTKDMMQCCIKNKIPYIACRTFKTAQEQFYNFFTDFEWNEKYNVADLDCVWFAVGSVQKYKNWIDFLISKGVRRFCVDMAHGDSLACIETIKYIKYQNKYTVNRFQTEHIIAGNVASLNGFKRLQKAGADGIRVGIASGSICFTPETNVLFSSNSGKIYKQQIKFIEVGDKVVTATGRIRKVINKFVNDYTGEIYKIDDVFATPNHKFYVFNNDTRQKEFIEIKNFDEKIHSFINVEGKTLKADIELIEYSGKVYNIEVDDEHTYVVGMKHLAVSNCSTALQTGFGVPILTNIMQIAPHKKETWLIADGGASHTGDIAKAVYFGADFVMMGKMLASTDLSGGACYNKQKELLQTDELNMFSKVYPHELQDKYALALKIDQENNGLSNNAQICKRNVVYYKQYHGLASRQARKNVLSYASVEGVSGLIKYTTTTQQFIDDTFLRLQASLSYGGAKNWKDFRKKVKACRRSNAGILAADTHLQITTDR